MSRCKDCGGFVPINTCLDPTCASHQPKVNELEEMQHHYLTACDQRDGLNAKLEAAHTRITEQSETIADMDVEYGKVVDKLETAKSAYSDLLLNSADNLLEMQERIDKAEQTASKYKQEAEDHMAMFVKVLPLPNKWLTTYTAEGARFAAGNCANELQAILEDK